MGTVIVGEPRIVERDGERLLVDDEGQELVVRLDTYSQCRIYHAADLDAFADGEIRPPCRICGCKPAGAWTLWQERALADNWSQCSFGPCFGGSASNAPRKSPEQSSGESEGYDRAAIVSMARKQNAGNQHTE